MPADSCSQAIYMPRLPAQTQSFAALPFHSAKARPCRYDKHRLYGSDATAHGRGEIGRPIG